MTTTDTVFSGSIPEIYDQHLVPLIFADYAENLASRVAALSPKAVLETAAGSGVVTRALAAKLSPETRYTVTDLNQPMLDHAQARQGNDARITWQQADALELPSDDEIFDVVCCQFGVMFFPDRVAGYREAHRVLKSGGRFIFNVWGRIEDNVLTDDVTKALAEIFPEDPPLFMARTPYGYHNTEQVHRDVAAAGFANVEIETVDGVSRAPSVKSVAMALCQGTPLRTEIEARNPDGLTTVTNQVADRLAAIYGDGKVSGRIQAHVVTGTC